MNKFDYFFVAGISFWALETWLFGFNDVATSSAERLCDTISLCLVLYGAFGGIGSSIKTEVVLKVGALDDIKVQ